MAKFGAQLRRERHRRWFTQEEVGRLVLRSANTISRWERGDLSPDILVQLGVLSVVRTQARKTGRPWVILRRNYEGRFVRFGRRDFRSQRDAELWMTSSLGAADLGATWVGKKRRSSASRST